MVGHCHWSSVVISQTLVSKVASLSIQTESDRVGEGIRLWLNPYRPSDDELEIQFENYGKKVSYFSGTVKLHIETTQFLDPFVPVFTCTINVYQMKIRQSGRTIMNWTPLLISLQNTNDALDIFFLHYAELESDCSTSHILRRHNPRLVGPWTLHILLEPVCQVDFLPQRFRCLSLSSYCVCSRFITRRGGTKATTKESSL